VTLRSPLGDRPVLDANVLPPVPVNPDAGETSARTSISPPPTIPLGDGTTFHVVSVVANDESACDPDAPPTCAAPAQAAELTVTAKGETKMVTTDSLGRAHVLAPADTEIEVAAAADGLWCATVVFRSGADGPQVPLGCTRLDLPHGEVRGTLTEAPPGSHRVRLENRRQSQSLVVAVEEGAFDALLGPGEWVAYVESTSGEHPCRDANHPFVVTSDSSQTLDLSCE
jgi:hypothetical protein